VVDHLLSKCNTLTPNRSTAKTEKKKKKLSFEPGMVVHACNSSTQRLRQEDLKFEVSLDYITRHCLKKESCSLN
jgi:hypothetical protein